MAEADPWAGLIDPHAALAAARRALAGFSSTAPNFSSGENAVSSTITEACPEPSQISSFSRPPSGLKQFRGENPNKKTDLSSSSYTKKSNTYASPAGSPDPVPGCVGDTPPAKAANPLKYGLTHSDVSGSALAGAAKEFSIVNTVPSPTAHLSGPLTWRDGLALLDRWAPPCPGFRTGEWESLHRTIAHFMDHAAVEAAARGWTAINLFGVHRDAGAAAVDSCGALMLPCMRAVTAVSDEALTFGPLVYRRRLMPQAVLAWEFAGGGWREDLE